MADEKLILEAQTMSQLTPAQVLNYLHSRFNALREMMAAWPPPPSDELARVDPNAYIRVVQSYQQWFNRYCIFYGRVQGSLEAAQAFGHIDVPTFEALKVELIGIVSRNVAAAVIGS